MIRRARSQKRTIVHQFKEPTNANPYHSDKKSKDTLRCQDCGSISHRGKWISKEKANGKATLETPSRQKKRCPACQQLKDRYALGVVEIHGETARRDEETLLGTILRTEQIAQARNDQERILWTKDTQGVLKVYVSLPELARHIGRELEKSFKGVVEYSRSTEEAYLRVRWWSDGPPAEKQRKRSKASRGRGGA